MTIGQLSKITDISVQTIRYYESLKLLPKPKVRESKYRVYDNSYIARLAFIKKAKELNFTLSEIKSIISFDECSDMNKLTTLKLESIRKKIDDYKVMKKKLEQLLKVCPNSGSVENCSIIKSIKK
jgi:DNA-binding transcriptional MerR regulator